MSVSVIEHARAWRELVECLESPEFWDRVEAVREVGWNELVEPRLAAQCRRTYWALIRRTTA